MVNKRDVKEKTANGHMFQRCCASRGATIRSPACCHFEADIFLLPCFEVTTFDPKGVSALVSGLKLEACPKPRGRQSEGSTHTTKRPEESPWSATVSWVLAHRPSPNSLSVEIRYFPGPASCTLTSRFSNIQLSSSWACFVLVWSTVVTFWG